MIKAIIFDLEDTLVVRKSYAGKLDTVIHREIAKKLSCNVKEARSILRCARARHKTTTMAIESLGLSKAILFEKLDSLELKGCISANEGAVETLQLLSQRGLKLSIITNMPRRLATRILHSAGIQIDSFSVVVTGSDTQYPKPAKPPFLRALSLLGVCASECIMIGDREDVDLRPAKELGMVTVILSSQSELVKHRVNTLAELVNLVDTLNVSV